MVVGEGANQVGYLEGSSSLSQEQAARIGALRDRLASQEVRELLAHQLRGMARGRVSDDRLEDMVQGTIINALQGLEKFKGESSLETWLNTIARNVYISAYRKEARNPEVKLERPNEPREANRALEEMPSFSRNIESALIESEYLGKVLDIVNQLPQIYKELFLAIYNNPEKRYVEIAAMMGVDHRTFRTRLDRGRSRIQEELDKKKIQRPTIH